MVYRHLRMTVNKLPRQLPYSHDVSISTAGDQVLLMRHVHALRIMPLLVGLAKCGHATKTL